MLKAIAVGSANDCAVAVAEHLAGTEAAFVERMNTRARELGCTNTTFINANGLDGEGQKTLTSARDLALISCELLRHPDFTDATRKALAIELLEREQDRYDSIVKLSELLARLAPMLGLLGTLIPLGPGIIALGQGDTYTLSTSLLTAFDTTIAGLVAAAFAIVVSSIRRRWYREYGSLLEALCTEVLELTKKGAAV